MRVLLAGYSLDSDVIEELKIGNSSDSMSYQFEVTPETLSAAYARISRDPRPINELRAEAVTEVSKAKRSNETIVFGMGHHSVAEHVQLNFDIIDISRLCIEALEEARLCAYTEKSQRYIKLGNSYFLPPEIGKSKLCPLFCDLAEEQYAFYNKAVAVVSQYLRDTDKSLTDSAISGKAQEDARYILGLSTYGQLGFSANARNLEYIIRKLRNHPLQEARDLSQKLYEIGSKLIPSLIILSDSEKFKERFGKKVSDNFLAQGREDTFRAFLEEGLLTGMVDGKKYATAAISLINHTPDPDLHILASLLHSLGDRVYSYNALRNLRNNFPENFKGLMWAALKHLTEYDAVYREFEHVTFTFELVVSASAFAQWKRHRMCSITKQGYNPSLGVVCPDSLKLAGLDREFYSLCRKSEELYYNVLQGNISAAEYILTNGHQRRILLTANLRELYHIARLRMDAHAQWEIRDQARKMIDLVKEIAPVSAKLACGKDEFSDVRRRIYG